MRNFARNGNGRPITYLALLQPHLNVIQVFLQCDGRVAETPDRSTNLELAYDSIKKDRVRVLLPAETNSKYDSDQADRIVAIITLPSSVELQNQAVTATLSDGVFDFKIPTVCSRAQTIPDVLRLSAKELQNYGPDQVRCRFCATALIIIGINASARPIFRPLPSPHYQELIEAYLCHPSGEFAKKMDSVGEQGFWPEEAVMDGQVRPVVQVGETELRADARHVEEWLRLSETDITATPLLTSRWDDVHCQCGAIIGERNAHRILSRDSHGDSAIRQTIKFWKHSICFTMSSGSSLSYPPEVFVMTEILSLAQAHSTRRFRLYDAEDEDQESPRVLLWLFQPDMIISYASVDEPATVSQVAKILYTFPASSSSESLGQRDNLQIEAIVYPRAIVDAVIASLRATTELLPVAHRSMGSHQVGFLARR